jgi:hypothetical protein
MYLDISRIKNLHTQKYRVRIILKLFPAQSGTEGSEHSTTHMQSIFCCTMAAPKDTGDHMV